MSNQRILHWRYQHQQLYSQRRDSRPADHQRGAVHVRSGLQGPEQHCVHSLPARLLVLDGPTDAVRGKHQLSIRFVISKQLHLQCRLCWRWRWALLHGVPAWLLRYHAGLIYMHAVSRWLLLP